MRLNGFIRLTVFITGSMMSSCPRQLVPCLLRSSSWHTCFQSSCLVQLYRMIGLRQCEYPKSIKLIDCRSQFHPSHFVCQSPGSPRELLGLQICSYTPPLWLAQNFTGFWSVPMTTFGIIKYSQPTMVHLWLALTACFPSAQAKRRMFTRRGEKST